MFLLHVHGFQMHVIWPHIEKKKGDFIFMGIKITIPKAGELWLILKT